MSGDHNSEALTVASLALSFHQAPARHADLMRGAAPLPPSVGILLRLAGGTAPQELSPSLETLASADELRKASLFFIEQVLFQRDANYYRLLGLDQTASAEQIKEHHRLLMRIFHPDRGGQSDERREQFATRANLAYNTLRDAETRAAYDETQRPPKKAAAIQRPRSAPAMARHRMPQPESFWSVRAYPLLMRYLPQWVLAGTALVSVTVVAVVYQSNQQPLIGQPLLVSNEAEAWTQKAEPAAVLAEEAIDAFESKVADAAQGVTKDARTGLEEAAPPVAVLEEAPTPPTLTPPARVAEANPPRVAATPQAPAAVTPPLNNVNPAPKAEVAASPKLAAAAVKPVSASQQSRQQYVEKTPAIVRPEPTAKPTDVKDKQLAAKPIKPATASATAVIPKGRAEPVPSVKATAYASPVAESARPVLVAGVATAAPPAPDLRPAPSPLPDPDALLKRFLEAYERGDMQTCMALVGEAARTDAGSKSELRRDYDTLFKSTDLRHIKIMNMNWSREGDTIRGEGQFRSSMIRKGETMLRTLDGQVRVELVRRGDSAVINELYYLANIRS